MKKVIFIMSSLMMAWILTAPQPASAANYALLMGVGEYPHLPEQSRLEGPAFDLSALENLLAQGYGFPERNVTVLQGPRATKAAILDHLNQLDQTTKADDFILVYFSGHGTSGFDPSSSELGIDPYTGAILPVDFELGSRQLMYEKAIIGRRDLHPIFSRLEKDRHMLVLFDCCYSGDTVRGVQYFGQPRYVALPVVHSQTRDLVLDEDGAEEPPYPYRNLVYISASSRREQAWDINSSLIELGFKTYDGHPHGAMTDALLKGLSGRADTNADSRVSYNELFRYVRATVSNFAPQTPQLLFNPDQTAFLGQSFGQAARSPMSEAHATEKAPTGPDLSSRLLRVKLETLPPELEKEISGLKGIEIVDIGQDISVVGADHEYRLYAANGNVLVTYPETGMADVVQRVIHQQAARGLIDYQPVDPSFNIFLNMLTSKGVLTEGETFDLEVKIERNAYLLLFDVDPLGKINIIYPAYPEELEIIKAGNGMSLLNIAVVPPFGIEHLKALAFKEKPQDMSHLMGRSFSPDQNAFQVLTRMIARHGPDAAEATLQVKTCSKDDLVRMEP